MSAPTEIAVALGLAALGRRVLCIRDPAEKPIKLARAVLDELTDAGGDGFSAFRSNRLTIENDHTGGIVMFMYANRVQPELGGLEFHHIVGERQLSSNDLAFAMSRIRLSVQRWAIDHPSFASSQASTKSLN